MIHVNPHSPPGLHSLLAPNLLTRAGKIGVEWERSNAAGIVRAGVDRPIHTRLPCTSSDVAIEDWDDLFRAVTTRLALAFDTPPAATQWVGLKIGVLDCVQALEQLRTTMTHELDRVRQRRAERQAS
jgi:hypothetical protein